MWNVHWLKIQGEQDFFHSKHQFFFPLLLTIITDIPGLRQRRMIYLVSTNQELGKDKFSFTISLPCLVLLCFVNRENLID